MNKDIKLLQGIINILENYDSEYSDNDMAIIDGLNRIVNEKWITVKGNHILVEDGQTVEKAISDFIEKKSTGGYSDKNKSNRAIAAELSDKDNITNLSKKLGISSSELRDTLFTNEWHHTNKNYTKTNYYYTDAYVDLKNNEKISKETIEKYGLNDWQIKEIEKSWNNLQKKLENKTHNKLVLQDFKEQYKDDNNLLDVLEQVEKRPKKSDSLAVKEIRRFYEDFKSGDGGTTYERLSDLIKWFSTAEREARKNKQ